MACAGNAPAPETEPANTATENVPQQEQGSKSAVPVSEQAKEADNAILFNSQALDSYRLATPENIPTATSANANTTSTSTIAPDPYVAVPLLINNIFAHADSLYKAGNTDSATTYLERFRVIKPLWAQWESKADSMLNEFGKTRAEKAKEFESLIREIQNMNRAKAAYSMVAEAADSLTALAPGDSLVRWSKAQKETAYKNTFAKAQKEYAAIKAPLYSRRADDRSAF